MLIDSGSDVTILKLDSLHDDVWIRDSMSDKLILTGIGSSITTIGQAECNIVLGNLNIVYPIHIVPRKFQLDGDGLIGLDLLERLGANVNYKDSTINIGPEKFKLSDVKLAQNNNCLIDTSDMDSA